MYQNWLTLPYLEHYSFSLKDTSAPSTYFLEHRGEGCMSCRVDLLWSQSHWTTDFWTLQDFVTFDLSDIWPQDIWPQVTFDLGTFDRKWHLTAGFLTDTPITMDSIAMSDNETLIIKKQNSYIFFMVCKKNCLIKAWFDKFYVILILVDGQKFRSQMSLAVNCPAVKCHLQSNVPQSNVTCLIWQIWFDFNLGLLSNVSKEFFIIIFFVTNQLNISKFLTTQVHKTFISY